MTRPRRRYRTFRFFATLLEVLAWLWVAIGLALAVVGFSTGGLIGALTPGSPTIVARFVASLSGVIVAFIGIFFVVNVQHFRAGVDTAEMTREMLHIMRAQQSDWTHAQHSAIASPAAPESAQPYSADTPAGEPPAPPTASATVGSPSRRIVHAVIALFVVGALASLAMGGYLIYKSRDARKQSAAEKQRLAELNRSPKAVQRGTARAPSYALQSPSGRWLDNNPPVNWNRAGMGIAGPPEVQGAETGGLTTCETAKPVCSSEESRINTAGWLLISREAKAGNAKVIWGAAGIQGNRVQGFQGFVFVGGQFAGTVSPTPMYPRTDGSAQFNLKPLGNRLTLEYLRYSQSDALCCPSRKSEVIFNVEQNDRLSLLVPLEVRTKPFN